MLLGSHPRTAFVPPSKSANASLFIVTKSEAEAFLTSLNAGERGYLTASGFVPRNGALATFPSPAGALKAIFVIDDKKRTFEYGALPSRLPKGTYEVVSSLGEEEATACALGWALGSYRFDRYKKSKKEGAKLVWPTTADQREVLRLAESIYLTRDLVNAPASDMGPDELEAAARAVAKAHGAKISVISGDALLAKNYPMIHAVGRASSRAPRLLDLRFGKGGKKLTLVGKGVCFDTGGLDIKPAAYMKLMKKDMGGAALVLGLANAIASKGLPVELRVLVPAVENSVAGNAMRPLDVLATRKGITVEIGDTDAEGRLVLGDALTEAISESPDLVIDAATLTGAARVALGTQMPAIFATKTTTWRGLEDASEKTNDPLWRLPLFSAYRSKLDSSVADLNNVGNDTYGGAITAALFLQEFTGTEQDWVHMDTMGYNLESRPGRPVGGEALGLLALDAFLTERFGKTEPGGGSENARGSERAKKTPPAKKAKTSAAGRGRKK